MKTNRRIASLTRTGYPVATWIFLAACVLAATLPASGQSLRDLATDDPVSDGLEVVEMTVVNPVSGDAFAEFVLTPSLSVDAREKVFTIDVGEGVDLAEVTRTMVVEAKGHAEASLPSRDLAKEDITGLRIDTTRSEPVELLAHFAQLHGQEVAVYFVKDGDSQLVQRIQGRVKKLEDVHVTVGDSKIPVNRVIAITLPHSKQRVRVIAAGKLKSIRFRRSVPRWHVAYRLKVKPGAGGDPELTGSASITNPTGHVLENANVILRREGDARFDVRLTGVSLATRAEGSHYARRLGREFEVKILPGHAFDLNQEKGEARRVVNLVVAPGCDGALPTGKLAVYVDDVLQSQTTLADLLPVQCLPGARKPLGTASVLHEGEQMIPFASVPGTQIAVTKGSIGKALKLGLNEITGVETWKIEVSNATRSDLDVLFYLKRDAKKEPDIELLRQTVKAPTTPDLLRKETFHLEFRKPKSGTTEAAPLTVTQHLHLLSKDTIAHIEKRTEDDGLKQRLKRLSELQAGVEANQDRQKKVKVRLQAALLHLDHATSARNHAQKQAPRYKA